MTPATSPRSVPRRTWLPAAGFVLALSLFATSAWLDWRAGGLFAETTAWVTHTHRIQAERTRLLALILDIEIAQRGYILTGRAEFLTMFEEAVQRQHVQERRLFQSTEDRAQLAALRALNPLVAERIAFARATIALRDRAGLDAAAREVATLRGKALTDRIRAAFAAMDARGQVLLAARSAAAEREAHRFRWFGLAGSGLGLVLFLGSFLLVRRESRLRHRAHRALAASEENLAVTLQSIGDGVLVVDAAGRITRLNAVAEALTGWMHVAAVGRPVADIFSLFNEETGDPARIPIADTLADGTIHGLARHTVLVARDGTRRPIDDSCAPIRDRAGQVVGAVLVFRDVSAERRHAAELRRAHEELEQHVQDRTAELRRSEARLSFALQASGIGAWELDLQDHTAHRTLIHDRIFGYEALLPEWTYARFIEHIVPADRAGVDRKFHAATAAQTNWDFECRIVRADGEVRWIWAVGDHERDAVGRAFRVSGIVQDITPRKRAEEKVAALNADLEHRVAARTQELSDALVALNHAHAQLAQVSRLKSEFLANMSHELRTPLNSVIGFAEFLIDGKAGPLNPRQAEYLGDVLTGGRHLLQLINDVLDLSKVEAGRMELSPEPFGLAQAIEEVRAVAKPLAQKKNLPVHVRVSPDLGEVVLDPQKFKQVLYNLLSNALKFTDRGGVTITAERAPGDRFKLAVQDTGIGIAAADLPRLFIEFEQLDSGPSRRAEGTGLGLALTKKIVELQGGAIEVESAAGIGSTFAVILPRQTPPRRERP